MLCPTPHPRGPRPSVRRNGAPESGFTLAELLIVVVIISILLALALPRIDPDRQRAITAMLSIGSSMQAAQREAVARQHDVIVAIDTVDRRLLVVFDLNSNGVRDGGERQRVVALGRDVAFSRAQATARWFGGAPVSFAAAPIGFPAVTFRRSGSASGAGGMYITSAKAAGGATRRVADTRAVEVIRATGRVEWWRYDGTAWQRGF